MIKKQRVYKVEVSSMGCFTLVAATNQEEDSSGIVTVTSYQISTKNTGVILLQPVIYIAVNLPQSIHYRNVCHAKKTLADRLTPQFWESLLTSYIV